MLMIVTSIYFSNSASPMLYEKLKVGVPLSGAGGFLSVSSSSLLHASKMKQFTKIFHSLIILIALRMGAKTDGRVIAPLKGRQDTYLFLDGKRIGENICKTKKSSLE